VEKRIRQTPDNTPARRIKPPRRGDTVLTANELGKRVVGTVFTAINEGKDRYFEILAASSERSFYREPWEIEVLFRPTTRSEE